MDLLKKVYKKSDSIVFRKIADEFILVPIRNNVGDLESIYTLNEGRKERGWFRAIIEKIEPSPFSFLFSLVLRGIKAIEDIMGRGRKSN